jgi:tetratricopeptide (TPR) repeat protein
MKKHSAMFFLVLWMLGLCVPPGFAQTSGTVKGVCKDAQGSPFADATVVYLNEKNDQKYFLKTNPKGEYFSLGITQGPYTVTLFKNAEDLKAGKEVFHFNKFQVTLDENTLDFDMKRQAEDAGLTPQQLKAQQEAKEKQAKEVSIVRQLNEKLAAAKAATDAHDYQTAINELEAAVKLDKNRDLIYFKLGDAYRNSAAIADLTDEQRKWRLVTAHADYAIAVELRKAAITKNKDTDPNSKTTLAAYLNNEAEACARLGDTKEAVRLYSEAAQTDPADAAQYHYNAGSVLTKAGDADGAIAELDKSIAADPNKADAYYQKGVNMIGKATLHGDKMVGPPGTAEAFNKYLELAPDGPYAEVAKQMLASIGASVVTGTKTSPKK